MSKRDRRGVMYFGPSHDVTPDEARDPAGTKRPALAVTHVDRERGEVTVDAAPEPEWVGWVVLRDGLYGFRRVRVQLPASVVATYQLEEPSGPDLRGNLAVQIQTDMMRDAFLDQVVRASKGER